MQKNTNLVKIANQALVIDAIRNYQPIKVEGITRLTKLSRQTVLTIMKDLQENNIIEKAGYEHQTVGRQAALYTLGSKNYFAIGLDCPTAYCGRCERHFGVGAFTSPTVRFGRQLQTLNGVTAHCRSLI